MKKDEFILNWIGETGVPFNNAMEYLKYIKNNNVQMYLDLEGTCRRHSKNLDHVFDYINMTDIKDNYIEIIKELDTNAYNKLLATTYKNSIEIEENLKEEFSCIEKSTEQMLSTIHALKDSDRQSKPIVIDSLSIFGK